MVEVYLQGVLILYYLVQRLKICVLLTRTMYLWVSCLSENEQRLFPPIAVYCEAGRNS